MATQKDLDKCYMNMAKSMAEISYGKRGKVGAVAVTENGVVVTGVNGLPKPLGNELEYKKPVYKTLEAFGGTCAYKVGDKLVTKPTVVHAESALLVKCAREGVSMLGSTVYVTLSCCEHCASMLASAGVKRVVYLNEYRNTTGIDVLKQCGIVVEKYIDTN